MAARKRGETMSAKSVVALMELEGVTKAARALGVAPGTLHRARNSGVVTKSLGLAAEARLQKLRKNVEERVAIEPQPVQAAAERIMERVPEALLATAPAAQQTPAPAQEPNRRAMMLVEGTERAIEALQRAAEFFQVKVEVEK